jgi:hypothetical protein
VRNFGLRNADFGTRNEERSEAIREPDLKKRTKAVALWILKLVNALPKTTAGPALASQIVRSGTSESTFRIPMTFPDSAVRGLHSELA